MLIQRPVVSNVIQQEEIRFMYKKHLIILMLLMAAHTIHCQSPHGDDFNVDCAFCHVSENWDMMENASFNHDTTHFTLEGRHKQTDCRQCHKSLAFKNVGSDCISCHSDIHQNTTNPDCSLCHTNQSWMKTDITALHETSRFPLIGAHRTADCYACHPSATLMQFDVLGVECFSCHRNDYQGTTHPNHAEAGYSTNCVTCHNLYGTEWRASGFEHGFFPLIQGHSDIDCATCHGNETLEAVSPDCYSCHQEDYEASTNPDHIAIETSRECTECHSLAENWTPAEFRVHDSNYFPIYSGKHSGEWNSCTSCHTAGDNFTVFTCTECHEHRQNAMNREHDDIRDYKWESNACYECHPNGREED